MYSKSLDKNALCKIFGFTKKLFHICLLGSVKGVSKTAASPQAKANQSEKVGMSQIQQPPYSSVPWKGRNF